MDISKRKYRLIEKVLTANEPTLEKLEEVLNDELEYSEIDTEQYNKELEEAEERIKNGKFYTQEEVREMVKKW